MAKTRQTAGHGRPAGLDTQAVWPSRVTLPSVTIAVDGSVIPAEPVPDGASVRLGKVPMPSQRRVRDESPEVTTTADVPAARARRGRKATKK